MTSSNTHPGWLPKRRGVYGSIRPSATGADGFADWIQALGKAAKS
jgi:hypothetical protein